MLTRILLPLFVTSIVLILSPSDVSAVDELPDWRIQVRAYGPDQSSVVSVHHRVTKRSEIGLQLDGTISKSESDEGEHYEESDDRSKFSISLRPEYRRWFVREHRLSTFWGWNILAGYLTSDTDSEYDVSSEIHTHSEEVSLGTGISFGADLELLDHLSVAMVVAPFSIQHVWTKSKTTGINWSGDLLSKRHDRNLQASFNLKPALYACIRF